VDRRSDGLYQGHSDGDLGGTLWPAACAVIRPVFWVLVSSGEAGSYCAVLWDDVRLGLAHEAVVFRPSEAWQGLEWPVGSRLGAGAGGADADLAKVLTTAGRSTRPQATATSRCVKDGARSGPVSVEA
jgi:hypothetical protein